VSDADPLRHENMEGRRWPGGHFALDRADVSYFFGTPGKIEEQETDELKSDARLVLAATHPELNMHMMWRNLLMK